MQDPSLSHATDAPVRNLLGTPGAIGSDLLMQLLGLASTVLVLPVAVWGWADPGESVTVRFAGKSKTTTAGTGGGWSLKLDALQASADSRVLTVTGNESRKIEVKDVVVGEVWFGSGQSNMAMGVGGAANFDAEKAAANFPHIRYYGEASGPAEKPQAQGKGAWTTCTPASVGRFSATLYFFGREIHQELGVPVGLICSAAGATHIESWVSGEAQSSDPVTKAGYDASLKGWQNIDEAKLRADYPKKLAAWQLAVEQGKAGDKDKAMRYANRAVKISPTNYKATRTMAGVYQLTGDFNRAVETLQKAEMPEKCKKSLILTN